MDRNKLWNTYTFYTLLSITIQRNCQNTYHIDLSDTITSNKMLKKCPTL